MDELEDGAMKEVPIGPEGSKATVLLHRHAGKFYATAPVSSHDGAPLRKCVTAAAGKDGVPSITCPDGAAFDLKTGGVVGGPGIDGVATYKAEVVDGVVFAELPPDIVAGGGEHRKVPRKMAKRDPRDERVFALLGGGPASLAAAETLRQEGFSGRIVMLTKEPHLPYDRMVLSKALDKQAQQLQLRPGEFFAGADIEVLREAVVTKLDTRISEVHFTGAGGGGTLRYDKVLVATGGAPRKLSMPGSTLSGIFTLRTPEDAAEITKFAKKGRRMVVVGGSLMGMEVASFLRRRGCEVAIVAMESIPLEKVLGKQVGVAFARLLQKEGVEWLGSAQVRLFRGTERVNGVELEDGEVLQADGVVIGAGVLPNTRFVEGLSLDRNGAIVVGPLLNSAAAPNVFAAGDVCSYPTLATGANVRVEHWNIATQQGRVAARNMLGQYQPFTTTPSFSSSLFGNTLRFVGHAPEILDRVIVEGDLSGLSFISYYTEDDEIRAVATVDRDQVAAACAELMRRGKMPSVSELMLGVVNADVIMQRLRDLSKA